MSQSATLYRVSKETFIQLEAAIDLSEFNIPAIAKSYTTLEGSFMGLEYVLSKGQPQETADLISEIFNPTKVIGEQEAYESEATIAYLDPNTVSKINTFLKTQSADQVIARYDSNELNENGIYPEMWSAGNSRDTAFNEFHLTEDLTALKDVFAAAAQDQDTILVFVG